MKNVNRIYVTPRYESHHNVLIQLYGMKINFQN